MKPASSRNPEIIRMFPDYADTVLWVDGPVDYVDTGLSGGLVEDLLAWEQSFYDGLNSNHAFRSRGVELKFIQEGVRLAKLVSSEIGSGHSVEYLGARSLDLPVLFRCPDAAANPAAAKCFDGLLEAKLQSAREMREILKDDPLYASAPLGDTVVDMQGLPGRSCKRKK